jgi:parallel beta-helix repeat protein
MIYDNGWMAAPNAIISGGIGIWSCEYVSVFNCTIFNNIGVGIDVHEYSFNIEIYHNTFYNNTWNGIAIAKSFVDIHHNEIYKNGMSYWLDLGGIYIYRCEKSVTIKSNNITYNEPCGIYLSHSSGNLICYNNFIANKINAFFITYELRLIKQINRWKQNYWDDWIGLKYPMFRFVPKRIDGQLILDKIEPRLFQFDWHPAREPYDI